MVRRLRPALVLGLLAIIWAPVLARANGDMERQSTDLVARERASAGVAAYAGKPDLVDVARRQAQRMAAEGRMYHNPNLGSEVEGWDAVGENVGRGPSVESIHEAFMASSTHRGEILSTTFTEVGIGVAVASDGEVWIAQVFRKPSAPPPPPQTAPAPAPAAAAGPAAAAAASARRQPASVRSSRASSPAPTPAAPPPAPVTTTTTTVIAPPDLSALEGAFESAPVFRSRAVTAPSVETDVEPDVTIPVRIAATLLVVVVAAQTSHVSRELGGVRVAIPLRTRLAASAATLP